MADTYLDQARRDAELYFADEWSQVADLIAAANTDYQRSKRDIDVAAEQGVNSLWRDFGRESHELRAAATARNMGISGAALSTQDMLRREKSQASADIRFQAAGKIMNLADELSNTISQAERTKQTVLQKKTLLVGQLRDKYRQEAEDRAQRAEANRIAAEQNRISRLGVMGDLASKGFTVDKNGKVVPLSSQVSGEKTWGNMADYARSVLIQGAGSRVSPENAIAQTLAHYDVNIKPYLDERDAGAIQFLTSVFPDAATRDAYIIANSVPSVRPKTAAERLAAQARPVTDYRFAGYDPKATQFDLPNAWRGGWAAGFRGAEYNPPNNPYESPLSQGAYGLSALLGWILSSQKTRNAVNMLTDVNATE